MKKSKSLTFFLSFVPGLGHFYLGQMNRGLQMMLLFFGSFFLFDFIGLQGFPFFIPVIWFYSLFDSLEQHRKICKDQIIIDPPLFSWETFKIKKQWIGWGMIIFGVYMVFDKISYLFFDWRINQTLKSILFAVILIIIGLYILSGKNLFRKKERSL